MRRLLLPAASTAVMLVVLCCLGVWQLQRLAWKTALLARIDAAEAAPGVPLPPDPAPFQKLRLVGRLRPGSQARFGIEVRDDAAGSQIAALLEGAAPLPLLVLLGWAPDDRTIALPGGQVSLEGYVRRPVRPSWFSPADDRPARRFYTLEPAVIGRALGAAAVMPFTVVALGAPPPAGYPVPAQALPRPPNDHLQYAITWFGLAAALVVVFGVYARKGLA